MISFIFLGKFVLRYSKVAIAGLVLCFH